MVPDREFVIPRARPDSLSGGYSDRRSTSGGGGGGKPLRTPSGREVSAQEYLYQDYRQASSRGRGYSRDDGEKEHAVAQNLRFKLPHYTFPISPAKFKYTNGFSIFPPFVYGKIVVFCASPYNFLAGSF